MGLPTVPRWLVGRHPAAARRSGLDAHDRPRHRLPQHRLPRHHQGTAQPRRRPLVPGTALASGHTAGPPHPHGTARVRAGRDDGSPPSEEIIMNSTGNTDLSSRSTSIRPAGRSEFRSISTIPSRGCCATTGTARFHCASASRATSRSGADKPIARASARARAIRASSNDSTARPIRTLIASR